MPPSSELVADKGYDSQALREWLDERGTQAVIPPRKNRKIQYDYDKAIYKQRNLIERMFCRLKDFRRIATRYDKRADIFLSAVCLAAAITWWANGVSTLGGGYYATCIDAFDQALPSGRHMLEYRTAGLPGIPR